MTITIANTRSDLPRLSHELRLAEKLGYREMFAGITTAEIRAERARQWIIDRGLADSFAGRNAKGEAVTFGDFFARVYGQPLEATTTGEHDHATGT